MHAIEMLLIVIVVVSIVTAYFSFSQKTLLGTQEKGKKMVTTMEDIYSIDIYATGTMPIFTVYSTDKIDINKLFLEIDSSPVEFVTFSSGNNTYTIFISECISPGIHTFSIKYYGILKVMKTIKVEKYVCIFPTIDFVNKKIVGFARWNNNTNFDGKLCYILDNGAAGEGCFQVTNGFFEVEISQLNFTYLLPYEFWEISYEDTKIPEIIEEPPSLLCSENDCLTLSRISEDLKMRTQLYGKGTVKTYINSSYIINSFFYPVEIKRSYIIFNYTITLDLEKEINIDPSKENAYLLVEIEKNPQNVKILECGGATCYWGEPSLSFSSNISGKTLMLGDNDYIDFEIEVKNTGSGDWLRHWCWPDSFTCWWKYCNESSSSTVTNPWSSSDCAHSLYIEKWAEVVKGFSPRLLRPNDKQRIVLRMPVAKLKEVVKKNGFFSYNGTWANRFRYCNFDPGGYHYTFRFSINNMTTNNTLESVQPYAIKTVTFLFSSLPKGKKEIYFLVNVSRIDVEYPVKFQITPLVVVDRTTMNVTRAFFYRARTQTCEDCIYFSSWHKEDIRIPSKLRNFFGWEEVEITNATKDSIDIKYRIIIANTGIQPVGDVRVYKKIGKFKRIKGGSMEFDVTPPEGWELENVGLRSMFGIYNEIKPYINFSVGSHREELNCSKIEGKFECNHPGSWGSDTTGVVCSSLEGKCWWKCKWCGGTHWVCGIYHWGNYRDVTNYVEDNKLLLSFSSNFGDQWFYAKASYFQKEELWKNHQEHALLILKENLPIYLYVFST